MVSLRFHHVGIACADLERAAAFVRAALEVASDSGPVFDPRQNATVRLFRDTDGAGVELVSGHAVVNLLPKGVSYYHTCYEVPDIVAAIDHFTARKCLLVSPPTPAVLFEMRKVAFVHSPLGLIELLEAR